METTRVEYQIAGSKPVTREFKSRALAVHFQHNLEKKNDTLYVVRMSA